MSLLVIGYGNTLRGDDGVGPSVAETLAEFKLPGVRAVACQQLTPELSEAVSQADAVIFVDAAMDGAEEVEWREVKADTEAAFAVHAINPGGLLRLAKDAFGRAPMAWTLAVPVSGFSIGEGLSKRACAGAVTAVGLLRIFARPFAMAR